MSTFLTKHLKNKIKEDRCNKVLQKPSKGQDGRVRKKNLCLIWTEFIQDERYMQSLI